LALRATPAFRQGLARRAKAARRMRSWGPAAPRRSWWKEALVGAVDDAWSRQSGCLADGRSHTGRPGARGRLLGRRRRSVQTAVAQLWSARHPRVSRL